VLEVSSNPEGKAGARVVRTGLIGCGIQASRSPWLHEREGAAHGFDLSYSLFDFAMTGRGDADLENQLSEAEAASYAGLNITYPFKQSIIPLLDELSKGASVVGAVNTVQFTNGRRVGHNTDVTGFAESLKAGLGDADLGTVLQLGCGGAGSATAHALMQSGVAKLLLTDVDPAKAAALVEQLAAAYGPDKVALAETVVEAAAEADGIVNATPMGMEKMPGLPLPAEAISARHWVADIVYFPLETALLREARNKGCVTLDGSGMAINQAAGAFEIFTGVAADRARMAASFFEFIDSRLGQTG
jgi:shikimate dehydrogenase